MLFEEVDPSGRKPENVTSDKISALRVGIRTKALLFKGTRSMSFPSKKQEGPENDWKINP